MPTLEEQLFETWNINNRINLYLLEATPQDALSASMAPKRRTVFQIFAHVHNVRLMWLKSAAPELLEGVEKLEGAEGDTEQIRTAFEASGRAIEALLRKSLAEGGRVKGFKPHVTAFVGYLIAHDSYHRAQIVGTLKQAGRPVDDKTDYGLWEWGVR